MSDHDHDDDDHPDHTPAREAAIVDAEVHDIVRALRPYGVLSRDALLETCHSGHWADGSFDKALAAAVRDGSVLELPGDFYRIAES